MRVRAAAVRFPPPRDEARGAPGREGALMCPIVVSLWGGAPLQRRVANGKLDTIEFSTYFLSMSNEAHSRVDDSRTVRGDVLALLRDSGALPRIEIARRTGVSPTTITRAVNQLIDEKALIEGNAISPTKLGRPATEISIKADSYFVIGVQIGVGSVRLGLIDVMGETHHSSEFGYKVGTPALDVVDEVATAIRSLINSSEVDQRLVIGVGIAVPGPVDNAGRQILMPINLDWRDVPVADVLEPAIGLPVVLEHNVRSMALAENRFGIARGLGSVAFVYLRTGIGAGLVVQGQPFSGGFHGAIELGHVQAVPDGANCVCGNVGCIETVLSEAALLDTIQRLGLPDHGDNALTTIWNSAANGDAAAQQSRDLIIRVLSHGLAAIVNLLNPEVILLGGALAEVPDDFFSSVTSTTGQAVFPLLRPAIRIEPSNLGMNAGVVGGATVALDRYFYV